MSQNCPVNCISNSKLAGIQKSDVNYSIFLSGETHHTHGNNKISLDLFRQFYKSDSVRIFIFEIGYCAGIVWNDYLENNNPLWIKYSGVSEDIDFAKELKIFYDSLSEKNKFKIVGIDYEKGMKRYFFPAIEILSPKIPIDTTLESTRMILAGIKEMKRNEWWGIVDPSPYIQILKSDIKNYEAKMIEYWGANYEKIKKIIYQFEMYNKVIPSKQKGKNAEKYSLREEYIYNNIVELYHEYPNNKMYGQFGRVHIAINKQEKWSEGRSSFENWESFASKLNTREDSPFKGKVCSMFIYCPKDFLEKKRYVPIEKKELIKLENIANKREATLFDLKCIDSTLYNDVVKTKFQYLIINKY